MPLQRDHGAVAIVLAAGSGTRAGAHGNKAYLPLAGRRMVSWTLNSIASVSEVVRTVLVIRAEDRERATRTVQREASRANIEIVVGGSTRHESEYLALEYLARDIDAGVLDVVLIHDAARPLAGPEIMRAAISVARAHGGAVPALAAHDLVTVDSEGRIDAPAPATTLVRVQTPQAFRAQALLQAYRAAVAARYEGTDTSSSVERFSDLTVRTFHGDESNIKVTYPDDLFLAERLLADRHYQLT